LSLPFSAPHLFGDRLDDFAGEVRALLANRSAEGRFLGLAGRHRGGNGPQARPNKWRWQLLGKGDPAMSVYVGIDVHRKRSQVAVVTGDGQVQLNKNAVNGREPILKLIGELPAGTPVAFEAAYGWG
jgi:hypothetical protein